jgi:hypothetical protein
MNGRITLLTDFGDRDGYVGAMKGVIAAHAPAAAIVDLCHGIPPGDIRHASWALATAAAPWPSGTTHVAVVDPSVGTDRRALAVAIDDQVFFAPDNGILTDVLATAENPVHAVELDNPAFWHHPVSATFHARDIFASCAAYLVAGVPVVALGSELDPDSLVRLPGPRLEGAGGRLTGAVIAVDRFGNAITNVTAEIARQAGDGLVVTLGAERILGIRQTFAEVAEGEPVVFVGSTGRLEVAVNGGSAAERFGLAPGSEVVLGKA